MSYIDIDEYGIVEIRCMKCNTPVAVRSYKEVPDNKERGKTVKVIAVKRLPNWRQRRRSITMKGEEAIIDAIFCNECVSSTKIDEISIKKKVIQGWQEEIRFQNKEDKEVEAFEKVYKKDMKEVGIKVKFYTDAKEEVDKKEKKGK